MSFGQFWQLFRGALHSTYKDGCFGIAKAAAYSGLLSFFPVLTSTATILVQANAGAVSRILSRYLADVVPPGTQDLVVGQFVVHGKRPVSLIVVAALLSVWAASGLMASLMEGYHQAYKCGRKRSFLRQRAVAILLVFSAALPAVGASALILFGARTEHWLMGWLHLLWLGHYLREWVALAFLVVRLGIALGTVVVVTMLMYRFGPALPLRWRNVWPGAVVATVLWLAATLAFAWYVRNIANYNVLYGSIGAVIALLVWMYLLAVIALIGCEFNAQLDAKMENGDRSG